MVKQEEIDKEKAKKQNRKVKTKNLSDEMKKMKRENRFRSKYW